MYGFIGFAHKVTPKKKAAQTCTAFCLFLCVQIESSVEAIHTPAGIYKLLLAGEERMAFGTNVHAQLRFRGAGLKFIAAGAFHSRGFVFGMNTLFHFHSPLSGFHQISIGILPQRRKKSKPFFLKALNIYTNGLPERKRIQICLPHIRFKDLLRSISINA